ATADRAAGLNGSLAQKVRDAIKSKLNEQGRMWTGGYSLFPEYSEAHDAKPNITGYRAENSITVETGELGIIGPLIDAAIAARAPTPISAGQITVPATVSLTYAIE